jgi:hypothetical protein
VVVVVGWWWWLWLVVVVVVVVVVGGGCGSGGGSGAAVVAVAAMVALVVGVYVMVVAAAAAVVVVIVASARIDPMCSPSDVVGRQCRLIILIRLVARCLKVKWVVSLMSLVRFLFLRWVRETVSRFRSVIGSGSIGRHAHFFPFRKRSEWCRAQTHFLMNCHNPLRRRDGVDKDLRVCESGAAQLHDRKIRSHHRHGIAPAAVARVYGGTECMWGLGGCGMGCEMVWTGGRSRGLASWAWTYCGRVGCGCGVCRGGGDGACGGGRSVRWSVLEVGGSSLVLHDVNMW